MYKRPRPHGQNQSHSPWTILAEQSACIAFDGISNLTEYRIPNTETVLTMSQMRPTYSFLCLILILIISGILAAPPKTTTTSDNGNDRPTVIKYKAIFSSDVLASAGRSINTFMGNLFRYVHIVPKGSVLQEQSSSAQNDSKIPFDIVFELNHVSIPVASKNRRSPKSEERATSNWIDYLQSTAETLANLVDKFLGRLNGDNVRVVRFGTDIVANNNTNSNNTEN